MNVKNGYTPNAMALQMRNFYHLKIVTSNTHVLIAEITNLKNDLHTVQKTEIFNSQLFYALKRV